MASKRTQPKVIGVLALQGDFLEHLAALRKLKVPAIEVRTIQDLEQTSGIILPGGESTTIGKLLISTGLAQAIRTKAKSGYAVYGTCAGAILIAKQVDSDYSLQLIDIKMKRNAYGRQLDSFDEPLQSKLFPKLSGVFIRAPLIEAVGKNVTVLASHHNQPVLVQEGKILAGSFHPELTDNLAVHRYFAKLVAWCKPLVWR